MNKLLVRLQFMIPSLPRAEKTAAEYMITHIQQMPDMTMSMLSDETDISEATIIRLCRRLGYSSYIQLRQAFASASNEENVPDAPELFYNTDEISSILSKLVHNIEKSLEDTKTLKNNDYEKLVNAIVNATGVYFFVSGDALISSEFAALKLKRIGIPAFVCSDIYVQYETAMHLTETDVAISITAGGRSANIVKSMKLVRENNALTCCITQSGRSPITKCCDVCLYYDCVDQSLGRDSVTKRISEMLIIETLYLGIINYGKDDYNKMLRNTMLSSEWNKL